MKGKNKYLLRVIGVLGVIVLGLVITGLYNLGQATPIKEKIRIGPREIVLGDEGDSSMGNYSLKDKKSAVTPPSGALKGLESMLGIGGRTVTLAYTCITDKLLFDSVLPSFQKYWLDKTGEQVNFVTGYALPDFDKLSTTVSGQPVQVMLLSSSTDALSRGFEETKWKETANHGTVLSMPQVFLVRKGNPKNIHNFADLAIPGIQVVHVNPLKGTGSGIWPVYAFYGSALKQSQLLTGKKDRNVADERLTAIENNAFYGADETPAAVKMFREGLGDVMVLSEPSALNAVIKDTEVELVVPPYTILNEFKVFKMEHNVGLGEETVVDGFIDYLFSQEVQEAIAKLRFRPSDPSVLLLHPEFKPLTDPFALSYLGGATEMKKELVLDKWLTINNNRLKTSEDSQP